MLQVGGNPASVDLGFPGRLDDVTLQAVLELRDFLRVKRPGPQHGLVDERFLRGIRHQDAIDFMFLGAVPAAPAPEAGVPFPGQLREHVEAHPHVLAPFGVMGGGGV